MQPWTSPQRTTWLIWAVCGCCSHLLGLDVHVRLLLPVRAMVSWQTAAPCGPARSASIDLRSYLARGLHDVPMLFNEVLLMYRWGLRTPVLISLPLPRFMASLGRIQVTAPASLLKGILGHPEATARLQKVVRLSTTHMQLII